MGGKRTLAVFVKQAFQSHGDDKNDEERNPCARRDGAIRPRNKYSLTVVFTLDDKAPDGMIRPVVVNVLREHDDKHDQKNANSLANSYRQLHRDGRYQRGSYVRNGSSAAGMGGKQT